MAASLISPRLTADNLLDLALELEDCHADLLAALSEYSQARETVASCKGHLERQSDELLSKGVEGRNAEQREANVRLELSADYRALQTAEREERQAKSELECKQLEWSLLRYRLRCYETAAKLTDQG